MKLLSLLHKVDISFPLNKCCGFTWVLSTFLARRGQWVANWICPNTVALSAQGPVESRYRGQTDGQTWCGCGDVVALFNGRYLTLNVCET
jgi:hypothetical protein